MKWTRSIFFIYFSGLLPSEWSLGSFFLHSWGKQWDPDMPPHYLWFCKQKAGCLVGLLGCLMHAWVMDVRFALGGPVQSEEVLCSMFGILFRGKEPPSQERSFFLEEAGFFTRALEKAQKNTSLCNMGVSSSKQIADRTWFFHVFSSGGGRRDHQHRNPWDVGRDEASRPVLSLSPPARFGWSFWRLS